MLIKENNPHGGDVWNTPHRLDFSANINPFGMPESVKRAIIASVGECEAYPDPYCHELRKKLGQWENLPTDNIICGNGAAELIYSFAYSLDKNKAALIVSPTFCEYETALSAAGVLTEHYILSEKSDFSVGEELLEHINDSLSAVFICSPNNPTGKTVPWEILCKLAEKCASAGVRLFCDFCFLDLAGEWDTSEFILKYPCVFALKAFTKSWAMAGIRLGYALCSDSEFLEEVSKKAPCWNVSHIAEKAGAAALDESEFIKSSRAAIKTERERLMSRIRELGVKVCDSEANYMLLRDDIPLHDELLRRGIMTRSCSNYIGLDSRYIRIAVRSRSENDMLLAALEEIYKTKA